MARINVGDIRGIYALLTTPAKANADDPSATDTIDVDETSRAIESNDMARAEAITRDMVHAGRTFVPNGDFHVFFRYNIPLEKFRGAAAGYMKAGPSRPPYHHVPEAYAEGARQAGREWAKRRERYRAGMAVAS